MYTNLTKFNESTPYDVFEEEEETDHQIINTHETKMKKIIEENNSYYISTNPNTNKRTINNHKVSSSLNFEEVPSLKKMSLPNNKIINYGSNIENYFVNNINISNENIGKNITINNINTINSMNSIKSLKSVNSVNNNSIINPFISDNFSARNTFKHQDSIKKGMMENKINKSGRINFFEKIDKKRFNNNESYLAQGIKNLNLSTITNNSTMRKSKFNAKDVNMSLHISPMKRGNISNISINSSQHNTSTMKNIHNLPKLCGDEEVDIFSDNDDILADMSKDEDNANI